jgi:hypothetical protein
MRRREFITLFGGAAAASPLTARTVGPAHIGFISSLSSSGVATNTVPTATPAQASSSPSQKTEQDCVAEWKADQQGIMARGVTEDSYVEQCLAANSTPVVPEPKAATTPTAPPK